MRGVIGCSVRGQDHRSNDGHSREEVTKAIQKLNARHPKALINIEDLAYITTETDDPTTDFEHGVSAQWAEHPEDTDHSELDLILISTVDDLEPVLSNSAFMDGISTGEERSVVISAMHAEKCGAPKAQLSGTRIDTWANSPRIMCEKQYSA